MGTLQVELDLPREIHNRGGPAFVSYTQYDTNGWLTLDLREPDGHIPEPTRTGEYTGLRYVAKVVSPPCVTVYWLVETISGWSSAVLSCKSSRAKERRRCAARPWR